MTKNAETYGSRPRRRVLRVLGLVGATIVLTLGVVAATFSPGWLLTPRSPFDHDAVPGAPDYAQDSAWAALPGTDDHADLVLDGEVRAGKEAAADVFFLHPTTYFSKSSWNAPIDDPVSTELLNEVVLAAEASVFNGCCRVFAPRYRQATLGSFYASAENAGPAFALAYDDVERAFDEFLRRSGDRPFVLAGHSQGSMHLLRLLDRIDQDAELRERLVVAYAVGMAVPLSQYGEVWEHLSACKSAEQVGCVAAWDTYREGATVGGAKPLFHWRGEAVRRIPPEDARQCTNPVDWHDRGRADSAKHEGGASPAHRDRAPSFLTLLMATRPLGLQVDGLADYRHVQVASRCEGSVLRVPDLGPLGFPVQETEPGNYHIHDYELFRVNVRANVHTRVQAFQGRGVSRR